MANGRNKREELIRYKGGRCSMCGYDKNAAALTFHHTGKAKKEFDLGVKNCNRFGLARLKKEADKCVLLCANCHAEIHNPDLTKKEAGNFIAHFIRKHFMKK